MARICLVVLLLLNYLLVVGAGLANRPEQARHSGTHPYVHSEDCQQRNYLRLDCFDTCNGDLTAARQRPAHETPQHVLSILKALDFHCLSEALEIQTVYFPRAALPLSGQEQPAGNTGFTGEVYSPPRRG
ncbi:MAG: hypothetical protein H7Z21_07225 [Hymenobacter sp.]|nr:hypothetical protein [Hymenobacter sp.]